MLTLTKIKNQFNGGHARTAKANKNIVYKLETAFDIIVTHEERHFEQAKEVWAKSNSYSGAISS